MIFMDKDTPNFIFKNINAAVDYGLIIANELPEITAKPRYEEIEVIGRSGSLNEWHGDYAPYDYPVKNVSIPYDRLQDVQMWLKGPGKLITHNDVDKYRTVVCNMNAPVEYENEWGVFYKCNIVFRSQPFRRKVNENSVGLNQGVTELTDHGMEIARPEFIINSNGGDISIEIKDKKITLINTPVGIINVSTEKGKAMANGKYQRSKGEWPLIHPGNNTIKTSGKFSDGQIKLRSVWL